MTWHGMATLGKRTSNENEFGCTIQVRKPVYHRRTEGVRSRNDQHFAALAKRITRTSGRRHAAGDRIFRQLYHRKRQVTIFKGRLASGVDGLPRLRYTRRCSHDEAPSGRTRAACATSDVTGQPRVGRPERLGELDTWDSRALWMPRCGGRRAREVTGQLSHVGSKPGTCLTDSAICYCYDQKGCV